MVRKNAERESEKTFTKVDMNGLLHDFAKVIPYEQTTFIDKIRYQMNDLGYIDIVSDDYKGYIVVLGVETKYTPKLKVYALANGNTITVKVAKKDFNKNPLQEGDVVRVTNQKRKARVKMSASGNFVPIENEFDWWLTKYEVIGK